MNETVEMILNESVPDDAAQAQTESGTLETLMDDAAPAPTQEPEQDNTPPAKEPGWIKQRISKAVDKAKAEVRAEYEAMLAPLRESMFDRQAQELVQSGEFKSLERAKEYVRLKNGDTSQPQQKPAAQQPRDDQGRFQQRGESENRVRATMLAQQAEKIQSRRGLDVMSAFNSDPDIKQRVLSGEWDFYDVADHLDAGGQQPQRRVPPAPVRSPNGAGNTSGMSIANMTDEQFERLQQNLFRGKRYDLSK